MKLQDQRDLRDHIGQGFSSQHCSHLGLDNSLLWASPCTIGCLAASLASLHQKSVATSNLTQVVTIKDVSRVSLVVQWLRIHLAMQGTWVRSWVWEDPICCEAIKRMHHNYWAHALEPVSCNFWAQVLQQLLKPARPGACFLQQEKHCNEKPPLSATNGATCNKKDPAQTKKDVSRYYCMYGYGGGSNLAPQLRPTG